MDSFSVEGYPKTWPKMFEAAVEAWPESEQKLGKDMLAAARKLAAAATEAYEATLPEVDPTSDAAAAAAPAEPFVRVSVLATNTGGYARVMFDVYVQPNRG